MARLLPFIMVLLCSFYAIGQQRENRCYTTSRSALSLLPELYRHGNRDKVDSLLNQWEYDCGRTESGMRLRTLLQIADNQFKDTYFDFSYYQSLLGYIEDEKFKVLMDSVHENPRELFLEYFDEPDLIFDYNQFTKELATELIARLNPSSDQCSTQYQLLLVYTDQFSTFFEAITSESCHSILSGYYKSQVKRIEKRALMDLGFYTGAWIPYGTNKLLGTHPLFGFYMGMGKKRMIYDLTFEFKFGKAKESYSVQYQGTPTLTNYFFGGYVGLDVGYELKSYKNSKIYGIGGIAYDGFDAIKSDTKNDVKGKSINSLNINGGIGWRLFARDGTYTGLEVRHNFVNYSNEGGTSLDGNTLSVRFLLGILKNDKRGREIEHLKSLTN